MIEAFSGIAGAIGLYTSAGLNAYLSLLVLALAPRYTSLIRLNEPEDVMTSGWRSTAQTDNRLSDLLNLESFINTN